MFASKIRVSPAKRPRVYCHAFQRCNPTNAWSPFSIPLNPTTFGAAPNTFASVLGNLTAVEVLIESKTGIVETVGFDNFTLTTPTPEPTTAVAVVAMLMVAGGRISGFRRLPRIAHAN